MIIEGGLCETLLHEKLFVRKDYASLRAFFLNKVSIMKFIFRRFEQLFRNSAIKKEFNYNWVTQTFITNHAHNCNVSYSSLHDKARRDLLCTE